MSKPRKDKPLKLPRFKGGDQALKQFIADNLKYPKAALAAQVEGAVEAAYDVDKLGKVRNIRIVKGLGHGCDEEVIRLIGLLPYETAVTKGRNVMVHKTLKVNFKLPVPKPEKTGIAYHYKKSETQKEEPKKKEKVYGITLTLKR